MCTSLHGSHVSAHTLRLRKQSASQNSFSAIVPAYVRPRVCISPQFGVQDVLQKPFSDPAIAEMLHKWAHCHVFSLCVASPALSASPASCASTAASPQLQFSFSPSLPLNDRRTIFKQIW